MSEHEQCVYILSQKSVTPKEYKPHSSQRTSDFLLHILHM